MRLVTYNMRSCLGMDGRRDVARLAEVIRDSDADIVCLQELDDRLPRSGFRNQAREIEGAAGMRVVFQRTIDVGVAGYGIAIGSRFPVQEIRKHRLPSIGEPRGCLEVRVDSPDGQFCVLCTHLGLSDEERVQQVGSIASRVRELSGAVLVAGDFNEPPEGRAVTQLMREARLQDAWPAGPPTYPSDSPKSRIDYVFHTAPVKVDGVSLIDTLASDHLPVVVDFTIL